MTTVHNLTPSPLRTVMLQSCTGLFAQLMWTPKASADCLDYVLDFSTLLAGTGDTLTAIRSVSVITATGGQYDLKVMWSAVAGTMVVAFLASGQPNTAQKILFEITTQQGRVYSVMAVMQITNLTAATVPPGDFPADTMTNGKVLIAGIEALPSGYSANGRVVMATEDAAPVGTPSFESVAAESYSGDGSSLNVTTNARTQTVAEWIASLASGGTQGVGIKSINVTQGPVVAGQPSSVTLTATLTDGTTTAPAVFETPAGAPGAMGASGAAGGTGATGPKGDTGAAGANGKDGSDGVGITSVAVSQGAVTAGQPSTVTLTATLTNGTTAPGVSFEAPAGAPGSSGGSADLTAEAINSALGYTAADASKCLPITGGAMTGSLTIGQGGSSLVFKDGSGAYVYTEWSYNNLIWHGGNGQGTFYWPGSLQTAAYAFASLPASPKDWCFAIVTDKAIGSGAQGVMAMWNPNTKAWTGLGGEPLV